MYKSFKCFKCSYCYDDRLNLYYLDNYERTETDEWVFFCKYTFTDEDFENMGYGIEEKEVYVK